MNCREFKQYLQPKEGDLPPEAEDHLDTCDVCRTLFEGEADLASGLDQLETSSSSDSSELDFGDLQDEIERDRGGLATLREAPLGLRAMGLALTALIVAVVLGTWFLRPDFSHYPAARFWGTLAGFVGVGILTSYVGLQPVYRSGPSRRTTVALLLLVLGYHLAVGLLPAAHTADPFYHMGIGADLLPVAAMCLTYGIVYALPACVVGWCIQQSDRPLLRRSVLLAAGLGTVGHLGLHLNCPIVRPAHRLIGHVLVPFAYTGLYAVSIYAFDRRDGSSRTPPE